MGHTGLPPPDPRPHSHGGGTQGSPPGPRPHPHGGEGPCSWLAGHSWRGSNAPSGPALSTLPPASPSTFHTSAPASKAPACPLPHPGYDQGVGRAAGPPSCVLGVCLGWGLGQEARAEGSVRCVVGDGAVATSGMPGVQAAAAEVVRRTCPQEPRLPRQGWHTPRRTSLPRPSDTHTPLASSQPLHGETQFLVLV